MDVALFPEDVPLFGQKEIILGQNDLSSAVVGLVWNEDKNHPNRLTLKPNWAEENGLDEEEVLPGEFKRLPGVIDKEKHQSQIIKEAISMSIVKQNIIKKRHEAGKSTDHLSGASFVPMLGIDKGQYVVAVYDSKYDYLLVSHDSMPIYDNITKGISIFALIDLWMLIHHNLFCAEPDPMITNGLKGTCNLKGCLGHRFQAVAESSFWIYMTSPKIGLTFKDEEDERSALVDRKVLLMQTKGGKTSKKVIQVHDCL